MTHYDIEIVSDAVCPWCYVGKNRLDLAISQHKQTNPSDTFSTTWAPFYLNPDAPKLSVDKQTLYEQKFGAQRTRMMQIRLAQIGKEVGIDFAYGGKTGNTRDAHRVIQLGKTKGEAVQTRVVEELFKAYFEHNEDITLHSVLSNAAVQAGLPEAETNEWLASDKGGPEVDKEVESAKRRFISGVPNFTVNNRFEVQVGIFPRALFEVAQTAFTDPFPFLQGAEEPYAFLEIFNQIKDNSSGGQASSGNTC